MISEGTLNTSNDADKLYIYIYKLYKINYILKHLKWKTTILSEYFITLGYCFTAFLIK